MEKEATVSGLRQCDATQELEGTVLAYVHTYAQTGVPVALEPPCLSATGRKMGS